MFTVAKNAQIVLSLLKMHNIRHIVINPGTTNVPIVQGVQNDPFFKCFSVVDERSAMYFAIGLYLELGVPIATTCTSAQATRNYIPGLTEAFYKHVPILALTVSKHPKFNYQGYPQHPIQTSLPEDAVKKTYALPFISNRLDELQCVRMVNEAILELTHRTPGPVQLNMPMLDTELVKFSDIHLPQVRMINRFMYWEDWNVQLNTKKLMIVIGESRQFSIKQKTSLENFVNSHNTFIYVNHLSNYQGKYSIPANIVMNVMSDDTFLDVYKPDILITIGGQTGDYALLKKLSVGCESDFEHWHVSEDGSVVDTYDKLTKVFECPFDLFFTKLSTNSSVKHSYYELWYSAYEAINIPEDLPLSNAYLASQLYNYIPKNSSIHFAILNSFRNWCLFPIDPSISCYSNVAAFGIDGCMSTFFGQSVESDNLCFLVIGDLSFFYDMNSLGIRHLKNNIRILLINNGCGVEFRMNNHLYKQMKDEIFPYIAAKGHYSNAKGWAQSSGFKYISASTKEEFNSNKNNFLSKSESSIIFEIFTKTDEEVEAYNEILTKNLIEPKMKSAVRSILGNKGVSLLKYIIHK